MSITPIEEFASSYVQLKEFLLNSSKISLESEIGGHLRKVFLLSCASLYENEIQSILKEFIDAHSSDERVLCFVTNKAIQRQYHTYFTWDGNNINSFLGLFGSDFKKKVSLEIKATASLEESIRAFLEIGNERNKMVHENFLLYNLEKTFEEIVSLNIKAIGFIEYLKSVF